jgi:HK97 family phage major capsid protein
VEITKELNEALDSRDSKIVEKAEQAAEAKVSEISVKLDEVDKRAKAIEAGIVEQRKFMADQQKGNQTFNDVLAESLKTNKDNLSALQEGTQKGNVILSVKAAATMTSANYSGGTVGLSQWDPSFALVARRNPFLRQIVNVRPVSSQYVAWAEQANRDGGAGATAEGAAKTQADFDMVEANKKVEKITSYTKVSKEALADLGFLQSEINGDLMSLVNLKLDTDLLSGNGTTPNLKGILEYATAFSAPTGTGNAVDNANTFDALRAAILQVELAYHQPNYIIMHPTDVALADMIKVGAGANEYINAPFGAQFSFRSFYGIPIIANAGMTRGDFLVGDFSKSNLGIREDVNISVGYDADDFTKNLVTILAEMRAVHYIKSNHTAAFVKGTIATVKTALETA